jgi:hypothetical protein
MHPRRNDFGAKLCIPLGTTSELRDFFVTLDGVALDFLQ